MQFFFCPPSYSIEQEQNRFPSEEILSIAEQVASCFLVLYQRELRLIRFVTHIDRSGGGRL